MMKTFGQIAHEAGGGSWELLTAGERKRWEVIGNAVAEECAVVCDDRAKRPFVDEGFISETEWGTICGANELAADAIRARSNVELTGDGRPHRPASE